MLQNKLIGIFACGEEIENILCKHSEDFLSTANLLSIFRNLIIGLGFGGRSSQLQGVECAEKMNTSTANMMFAY